MLLAAEIQSRYRRDSVKLRPDEEVGKFVRRTGDRLLCDWREGIDRRANLDGRRTDCAPVRRSTAAAYWARPSDD